jgi:hypothetical protein
MFKYTRLVQGEKLLKYVQILLLQRVIYMLEQQNIECYCLGRDKTKYIRMFIHKGIITSLH